jgi:hypothetical protein
VSNEPLFFGVKSAKSRSGGKMTIKNEAIRLFLAAAALILTAMLTHPPVDGQAGHETSSKKVTIKKIRRAH